MTTWFATRSVAAQVALLYAASRAVTTCLMLLATMLSPQDSRHGADPTLVDYILGWDARWYWIIATQGYPSVLPTDSAGVVEENQWAFMPLYPFAANGVAVLLGGGAWWVGALVVSLAAGLCASLAMYWLMRDRLTHEQSLWAVAFLACCPVAAMFQVGYAEALFLAMLLTAIRCVDRGWWGALYVLVPLMGFIRPGILAFGLFIALYGLWRLATRRNRAIRRDEIIHILALGALATVVGFSWQVIAGIVTDDPGAYLATELAWRAGWTGETAFVPFDGWIRGAVIWSGLWDVPAWLGVSVLAAVTVAFLTALRWAPAVRALGVPVRLWSVSYAIYLLAVFFPQSSTFRLLLPLAPLLGAFSFLRDRWWRTLALAAGIILQWGWIYAMYGLGNSYATIP